MANDIAHGLLGESMRPAMTTGIKVADDQATDSKL